MDLKYLDEVLKTREQEIKDGKNLHTVQPIYVVLDLHSHICSGHSDYSPVTNYKDVNQLWGYIDESLEPEDIEFCGADTGMKNPEEVTKFYTDRVIAFFLTSESAHEYLKYQSHNLTNPYVYVFSTGYRNWQMDKLLKDEN